MRVAPDPVFHRLRQLRPAQATRRWIAGHPRTMRWLLAGPGAIAAGLATMMAMPVWLPTGAAGIDNIAIPIVLTPLLWALPFFYACLVENLSRAAAVLAAAILAQAALVALTLA